jgi:hypothetical protein
LDVITPAIEEGKGHGAVSVYLLESNGLFIGIQFFLENC